MILPPPQSGFSVRGVPIHSSSSSHPTFPSNPTMTSNSPSLLPIDSDTKDTRSLEGILSQWRMVIHMVIHYGHPDQAWVREKMLCVAVEQCWWGGSWPCCSGLIELCATRHSLSLGLSFPIFTTVVPRVLRTQKKGRRRRKEMLRLTGISGSVKWESYV